MEATTLVPDQSQSGPVTTRFKQKPFSWSFSRLKNFEICPLRHQQIDLLKTYKDLGGENLLWGNSVHDAMAKRLGEKIQLPPGMIEYEPFVRRIEAVVQPDMRVRVEQEYAVDVNLRPSKWFGSDTWLRVKVDAEVIGPHTALAIDWKTGGVKEDSIQLALTAQILFAHYPNLHVIGTRFAWLKEHAETDERFKRSDMPKLWIAIGPRIERMKQAYDTGIYPATPKRFFCEKQCPVTSCAFHGKPQG